MTLHAYVRGGDEGVLISQSGSECSRALLLTLLGMRVGRHSDRARGMSCPSALELEDFNHAYADELRLRVRPWPLPS
jgi:hypothetical protein